MRIPRKFPKNVIIVPVVEVEVGPDLNGSVFVLLPRLVIATFYFPEAAAFNDYPFRHDELQRRIEGAGRQFLVVEESLQALQISRLGLTFANDDVARRGHRMDQRAGCGTPE